MASVPITPDANWSEYAKPNSEFEQLLPNLKGFTLGAPGQTVEFLRNLGASRPHVPIEEGVGERDIEIVMRDGHVARARVYSPSFEAGEENGEGRGGEEGDGRGKALLVMLFGGGFVIGKLEHEAPTCRKWVKEFGGVAVSIEHRLCPEVKFPVPVEDAFDTVKWIAANAKSLGADAGRGFVLGGVSSGAVALIAISHLWRDENILPPITGLFLAVPGPCLIDSLPEKYKQRVLSWDQCADAPVFNRDTSTFLSNIVQASPSDIFRSPLLWPTGHANLPPAYFMIAGRDPWRDVGLLYEEVLREYGVKTRGSVWVGLPHGFWGMVPKAGFSEEYWGQMREGLGWLLMQGARVVKFGRKMEV